MQKETEFWLRDRGEHIYQLKDFGNIDKHKKKKKKERFDWYNTQLDDVK